MYKSSTAAVLQGAGEEQICKQEIDKKLMDFINRFLNRPVKMRKAALEIVEKVCGGSNDDCDRQVVQFFRDLCEEADKRDVERRGA